MGLWIFDSFCWFVRAFFWELLFSLPPKAAISASRDVRFWPAEEVIFSSSWLLEGVILVTLSLVVTFVCGVVFWLISLLMFSFSIIWFNGFGSLPLFKISSFVLSTIYYYYYYYYTYYTTLVSTTYSYTYTGTGAVGYYYTTGYACGKIDGGSATMPSFQLAISNSKPTHTFSFSNILYRSFTLPLHLLTIKPTWASRQNLSSTWQSAC